MSSIFCKIYCIDLLYWTNCERSELPSLFNGTDFYIYVYIFQAVRRAVNVLNVSTCM